MHKLKVLMDWNRSPKERIKIHERKCKGFAITPVKKNDKVQGRCNMCNELIETFMYNTQEEYIKSFSNKPRCVENEYNRLMKRREKDLRDYEKFQSGSELFKMVCH